jgi:hypothetical protein
MVRFPSSASKIRGVLRQPGNAANEADRIVAERKISSCPEPFAFLRDIDCCMAGHGVFPSIAEQRLVLDTISLRTANLDARAAPRDYAK